MDILAKQAFIRLRAQENQADPLGTKILWSRHAIAELVNEELVRAQVEHSLKGSELIEDYPPLHRALPDCLVLGWLASGEPIHSVVAIDQPKKRLLIVTVYRPSLEEWEDDWKTRKE